MVAENRGRRECFELDRLTLRKKMTAAGRDSSPDAEWIDHLEEDERATCYFVYTEGHNLIYLKILELVSSQIEKKVKVK